jgi:hypothetical protein
MTRTRAALAAAVKPFAPGGRLLAEHIGPFNDLASALGIPPDPVATPRLTVEGLQEFLGVLADGKWGNVSKTALLARLTNTAAPGLTPADFTRAAGELGVFPATIRAVRKIEAPRGPFDENGRPAILYERHVANRNTEPPGAHAGTHPALFGPAYGPGGYGAFSAQYGKLLAACAVDPEAAFRACSWGAFQVLGENAVALGYPSALAMALELTKSEAAHLDSFVRFVKANGLEDELRACRPRDPESCVPFVKAYNGPGFKQFNYHTRFAAAIQ